MARRKRNDKLTTSARKKLQRRQFAWPAKRLLPIENRSHIGPAASRLAGMLHRGELSRSTAEKIHLRIRKAGERFGVKVKPLVKANPKHRRLAKPKVYRITSSEGVEMGLYEAQTPAGALDAMARDAGYSSNREATDVAGPFEGTVVEVGEENPKRRRLGRPAVPVRCRPPYRARVKRRCFTPNPSASSAERLYKKLHWGLEPSERKPRTLYVSGLNRRGEAYAVLGELAELGYLCKKGLIKGKGGKSRPDRMTLWDHRFDAGKTFLLVNSEGELLIAKTSKTGGYRVTERGIVG